MFQPIPFLQQLIRIPSSDPPGGELHVARAVHAALMELGIEADLDEFQPDRANVIGRIAGWGEKAPLVFSAHMDTVPVGDQPWDFDALSGDLVDGQVRGRGASDMKSALAAFIAAAEVLARRDAPLAGDVLLAFTAGESASCLGAKWLVEQGFQDRIGAFLCGEPSSLDIIVAEKAVLWLEAVAQGRQGHVSGDPGINAIERMVDFLTALRGLKLDVPDHPLLTPASINVGRINGGTAIAVTPARCRADIDVRYGPGVDKQDVIAQIQAILPDGVSLRETEFKTAVDQNPDSPFVQTCAAAVRRETGADPAILGVSYYSDGAVLLDGLDVPFAILGPGILGMSGQVNETVSADNVAAAARMYVQIAEEWLA